MFLFYLFYCLKLTALQLAKNRSDFIRDEGFSTHVIDMFAEPVCNSEDELVGDTYIAYKKEGRASKVGLFAGIVDRKRIRVKNSKRTNNRR